MNDLELLERLDEEARIYASELVGPNSPEFEAVRERKFEELSNELA